MLSLIVKYPYLPLARKVGTKSEHGLEPTSAMTEGNFGMVWYGMIRRHARQILLCMVNSEWEKNCNDQVI